MILALKTAGPSTYIALYKAVGAAEGDGAGSSAPAIPTPLASLDWESGRDLSLQLLGKLSDFLAQRHLAFTGLTGIIIFSGPGSFTSLRIGHTVANALADSLDIPLAGGEGHEWEAQAITALKSAKPGHPALPHYGAEAHITRPKD